MRALVVIFLVLAAGAAVADSGAAAQQRGSPCATIDLPTWSPDGAKLAYADVKSRLRVVDVATRQARNLLQLHFAPTVSWSPDAQQLLVNMWPKPHGCFFDMWRVPADGSKPPPLRRC